MRQGNPKGTEVVLPEMGMEINQLICSKCSPKSGTVIDALYLLTHMVPNTAYMTDMIAIITLIFQFKNLKL